MALLLTLEAVYLESCRFSHRADYLSIDPAAVNAAQSISSSATLALSDDGLGALVKLRVNTLDPEEATAEKYSFEVVLACAFRFPEDTPTTEVERNQVIASGVATLMPFAREAVASITSKGRFGVTLLPSINSQIVMEQLRSASAARTGGSPED